MEKNSINKHKSFTMPWELIEKIEDYKEVNGISSFAQATYELIRIGLQESNHI
jgi:hypothetical protein